MKAACVGWTGFVPDVVSAIFILSSSYYDIIVPSISTRLGTGSTYGAPATLRVTLIGCAHTLDRSVTHLGCEAHKLILARAEHPRVLAYDRPRWMLLVSWAPLMYTLFKPDSNDPDKASS